MIFRHLCIRCLEELEAQLSSSGMQTGVLWFTDSVHAVWEMFGAGGGHS